MKRHKEPKHEGIRYPCDQCEYTATQNGNLKSHKKEKHSEATTVIIQNNTTILKRKVYVRIEKLDHSEYLSFENKVLEPEFIETLNMNVEDTEIKKEEGTDGDPDPLSGTNNLIEQDPLEDYEPPVKKEKIEDEDIAVKEELVD